MSIWTEVRGTVKIPHKANFSIKKSFENERWEGVIRVKHQASSLDFHTEEIIFSISEDCIGASAMIKEWFDKFPKGCKIDLQVKGRILL